jgi:Fe-S-cluster containining protein
VAALPETYVQFTGSCVVSPANIEPNMILEAGLPTLYAPWLRTVTGGPIPAETRATCQTCVMLPAPGGPADGTYFHPATKCCAFQPHIPNFLAGRILMEEDPSIQAGREELERRIARRVAISPRWAGPGSVFDLLYRSTPNVFGRAPELRCQFLDANGGCGVWKHRPAVCSTWFCKHVRGATGHNFWKVADKLLQLVEQELGLWCLAELKVGSAEVLAMSDQSSPDVSELGGEMNWGLYRKTWGDWVGREADFYRACARLVDPLTWEQVERVSGPRVRILAQILSDAYKHLESKAIPERLRLGRIHFTGVEAGGFRIVGYSGFDPLLMPEKLARTLKYFDGKPIEETLEAILTRENIRLDMNLVRKMVDFGILQRCSSESDLLPIVNS